MTSRRARATAVTRILLPQAQPEQGPGLGLQAQLLVHEARRLADRGDLELESADRAPRAARGGEVGAGVDLDEAGEVVLARAVGRDLGGHARDRGVVERRGRAARCG